MHVHTYNVCVCLKKTQFESMAQKKKKKIRPTSMLLSVPMVTVLLHTAIKRNPFV